MASPLRLHHSCELRWLPGTLSSSTPMSTTKKLLFLQFTQEKPGVRSGLFHNLPFIQGDYASQNSPSSWWSCLCCFSALSMAPCHISSPEVNSFECPYFSERYLSRIDTIWIARDLATKVPKIEIFPKTFSDPNPVNLIYKRKSSTFRWRLNKTVSQKEAIVEDLFGK